MDKTLNIGTCQSLNSDDYCIAIEHSEEFFSTAKELSEHIKRLSIKAEENNRLVELALKHAQAAVKDGIIQGFKMGMEFQKFEQKSEEAEQWKN